MNLTKSVVSTSVEAPIDEIFMTIAPIDLPLIFTGFGALPAVCETKDQTGCWDAPGQTRTVCLSDNSTARETLEEYQRPFSFAYSVTDFTGILRLFVRSASGKWTFRESGNLTSIIWEYNFIARTILALPVVVFIAKLLWRGYMKKALRMAIKQHQNAG